MIEGRKNTRKFFTYSINTYKTTKNNRIIGLTLY